jgi:hypothetical protein
MITVDITPQWDNLVDWFWENYENLSTSDKANAVSIWDLLKRDYGIQFRVNMVVDMVVDFPDEESYMMFLLKWS